MPPWPDPGEAAITDLKTLLDAAVSGEEFAGPGLDLYPAAERAVRRRGWIRAAASAAGVAVIAGGALSGTALLDQESPRHTPVYVMAAAAAPSCVRTELAIANEISAGHGWKTARAVEVLQDLPGLTPSGSFSLWEGATPDANPAPGAPPDVPLPRQPARGALRGRR